LAPQQKPINNQPRKDDLNILLTEGDIEDQELYAAERTEKPPEVKFHPYKPENQIQKPRKSNQPSKTQKERMVVDKEPLQNVPIEKPTEESTQPEVIMVENQPEEHMEMDKAKKDRETTRLKHKSIKRIRYAPTSIDYDIVRDVFQQKASIEIGDLLKIAAPLRARLATACRKQRQKRMPLKYLNDDPTMNTMEETDIITTAVYAEVKVGNQKIRGLIDCGASRSCMSRSMMKALNLEIDAPSNSVFTLGNGNKQPTLGLIQDVPVDVGNGIIIPSNIEVIPRCPAQFILGNNWLSHAQAIIDFPSGQLRLTYKRQRHKLPITYIKQSDKHVLPVKVNHINYKPEDQDLEWTDDDTDDSEMTDEETEEEGWEHDERSDSESGEDLYTMEGEEQNITVKENKADHTLTVNIGNDGLVIPPYHECNININTVDHEANYHFRAINAKRPEQSDNEGTLSITNKTGEDIIIPPGQVIADFYHQPKEIGDEILEYAAYELKFSISAQERESIFKNDDGREIKLDPQIEAKLQMGDLSEEHKRKFYKLIDHYKDIFDWNNDKMGLTTLAEHEIVLENEITPIRHRPYRISPEESNHLKKELDRLCEMGIIKPSNTPFTSPIILVKKKNGEYRMVVDYRKLNKQTRDDPYPLPRIDDLIDELGDSRIFSALDLRSGFHQVPMKENSKYLTGFTTKFGVYEYITLPMGLKGSPACFQRLIDVCYQQLLHKCLVAFIDDLNVHSKTMDQHLIDLENLFFYTQKGGLVFNIDKCTFFRNELKFLGYIITQDGIKTDDDKIKKVREFPIPTTIKQVRGFIGLASYYRRFVKDFAKIARPLHNQTKTDKTKWGEEETIAFEKLKEMLTTAPILKRPDFEKEFFVHCDGSKLGIGAILSQFDDENKEHPVIYLSRGLRAAEKNYGASKLECLALVFAVTQLRPYLLGHKFTVITDHQPLKWILESPKISGITARWMTYLADYDFELRYKSGKLHQAVDFMSRLGY
jgi:hypothetical protein